MNITSTATISDLYLACCGFTNTPPAPHDLPDPENVEICRYWLRRYCSQRKTLNPRAHSYILKHCVERWLLAAGKGPRWIGTGEVIQAAINEKYNMPPIAEIIGRNTIFNMRLPLRDSVLAEEAGFIVYRRHNLVFSAYQRSKIGRRKK